MSTCVTKYRRASVRKAEACERWPSRSEEGRSEVVLTKRTNSHNVNTHLRVMEVVSCISHCHTTTAQCRYDSRGRLSVQKRCPSIPPSVHRSPASLTTLTVHTKGVHKKIEEHYYYCYDYCYIIIDYSPLIYMKSL